MAALFVELDEAQNPVTTYIRHEDGRIDLMVSWYPLLNDISCRVS